MPKRAAISATGISAVLSNARIVLTSLGESFAGRPPVRPRARAAFRPTTVRSRIRFRTRSARLRPQPIKPPNYESVAFTQTPKAAFQLRSPRVLSAGLFLIHLTAPGMLEPICLQIEGLVVGRDTSVADAHVPNLIKARVFRTQVSGQVVRHF
jgi:hypothetical protein